MTLDAAVRTRLDSLTSLRFMAALVVVLSHSSRDLVTVPVVSTFAHAGTVGVGFFFALSGFVLMWSHRGGDSAMRFYRRRFARVYPMHFLTYLLAFPILLLAGTNMGSSSVNTGAAVASPFLVQAWFPQSQIHYGMNAPSWSLSDETFFYLLFPLIVPAVSRLSFRVLRSLLIALPLAMLAGAVLCSVLLEPGRTELLYLLPAWRVLGFIAGVVLARCVQEGMRPPASLKLAIAVVAVGFLLLPLFAHVVRALGVTALAVDGVMDALMLPLFLLLIAVAATADIRGIDRWIARPRLVKLGEWSFALYLTHWLLIDLVVGVFPNVRALSALPALGANIVVVLLAIGVSGVFYGVVERPLERRLRAARPRSEEVAVSKLAL